MDFGEFRAAAADRSRIYWMLSRFFVEPPAASFLAELGMASGAHGEEAEPGLVRAMAELRQSLEGGDFESMSEGLRAEFTRLFRGIQEGYGPPPPYESLYREGRLMGETTEAVQSQYRNQGFGVIDETVGPQDHIGAELKFLAFLCHRESEAWRQGDSEGGKACLTAQGEFLERHLLRWAPDFCQRVQAESGAPFYRAVAELTAISLDQDSRQVDAWLKGLATGESVNVGDKSLFQQVL